MFCQLAEMTSMVAKAGSCSAQVSSSVTVQENGSRNKRKFRADPPFGDTHKIVSLPQSECSAYEFSADKFEIAPGRGQSSVCDYCSVNLEHSDNLKLDLGLSSVVSSSEVGLSQPNEELEADEFQDADWNDLTEAQLEELVLSNLDSIFKTAILKIMSCGYTEEVARKAILRSGLLYGSKDTVSNIVDNTLAFLGSGQEIDPSREHCFDNLQQLEMYLLAELVCVLREVRPFFSTGDAMWCLLICDMNVSHACAMDGDPSSTFGNDDSPNGSSSTLNQLQLKVECKSSELHHCSHSCQSKAPVVASVPSITKPKASLGRGRSVAKEGKTSASEYMDKSFSATGTSQSTASEEKLGSSRRVHSVSSKREYMLRQKSLHLDKGFRTYGKGSSRSGKLSGLGGLILDKKLKSVSDSNAINLKHASLKISKAMGVDVPQDHGNHNTSANTVPSFPVASSLDADNTNPISVPKTNNSQSTLPAVNSATAVPVVDAATSLPASDTHHALSAADTELSLTLSTKSNSAAVPIYCTAEAPNSSYAGIPYDKSLGQWAPRDKKDEMVLKLVPRVRELQNQMQEWTEWANQKVMQAARRLGKEKEELKTLRQEKEEVERLKKEKQTLEENTMKKLSEMEYALSKASGQVERANSAVRRLEVENAVLRQEMEAAKLRAAESAASCQEVSKREKKTSMEFQSWEKHKAFLLEEFTTEKRKLSKLIQELEQAKVIHEQLEARWQQEDKAKEELLMQTSSMRKDREQIEVSTKSKEDMIKLKAEKNLQKYKDDIQKLEKEISQLRLKTESPKIAALRRGIDGSYASKLTDVKSDQDRNQSRAPYTSEANAKINDYSETGGVKRERECVMCLSEEMSVVFLPCAHQVVCTSCNELHEKQGMKDCPSCRSPIQRRISVRYARS
ncbi:putative E3 ubiquitin-protein ligase RF298 isoform X2 [Humulus lupulus]|uniref:putative E3 ubiquitin-protein ligase RF298 isoform X2 n=1 Tax=Humulus lupulus TaxID=3486 RepID=UPI002B41322C|nr:putative E3 ubiquitin-protein ligase RF298 isoform X2 [Humulus lupulus]XP_062101163.1 putative E3 ubiquitin-protein ligase RF298 isoform X2 [Humulus lupulus]